MLDEDGKQIHDSVPFVINGDYTNFLLVLDDKDKSYKISFKIYSVITWSKNEKTGKFEPCQVALYLTGMIKWDGCSHLWFGEKENGVQDGYLHLCGKAYWMMHNQLMNELYDYAEKTIEHFDLEVAS